MKWKYLLATFAYSILAYCDIHEQKDSLDKFRMAVAAYCLLMSGYELNDLFTPRGSSRFDLSHYTAGLGYGIIFLGSVFNSTFL